jgi:hypothetical protein
MRKGRNNTMHLIKGGYRNMIFVLEYLILFLIALNFSPNIYIQEEGEEQYNAFDQGGDSNDDDSGTDEDENGESEQEKQQR